MPKTITIKSGTITVAKTEFKCSKCDHLHTDEKYYNRIIRLTLDYKGDIIVINHGKNNTTTRKTS